MNDLDLLDYFCTHSRTEVALFNREHVQRLCDLAGVPLEEGPRSWFTVRPALADTLIIRAVARMAKKAAGDGA